MQQTYSSVGPCFVSEALNADRKDALVVDASDVTSGADARLYAREIARHHVELLQGAHHEPVGPARFRGSHPIFSYNVI